MVQRSNIQVINGRKIRTGSISSNRLKKLESIQNKRQRVIDRQTLNNEVNRLDKELVSINFGGSIQNFDKQFNEIKKANPQVASKLKNNPKTVREELNRRISQIRNEIARSKEREARERKQGDKANRDGERARQKGLNQGLSRLNSGELLTVSAINTFANDLRKQARDKRRVKESKKAKASTPKIEKVGNKFTVKIGNVKSTGSLDFVQRQVARSQGIKVSSPKKIISAIEAPLDKSINLKKQGFSKSEITLINKERAKRLRSQPKQVASFATPQQLAQASRKKSISTFVPEIKTKNFTPSGFTQRERELLKNAKNPTQALNAIADLRKREATAVKQRVESFLKVSLPPINTPEQAKAINSLIKKQIARESSRNIQLEIAKAAFRGEFDKLGKTFRSVRSKDLVTGIARGVFNIAGAIVRTVVNPRNKTQVNIVKDNIGSVAIAEAFKYGRNLRRRFESGENNSFFNDIKPFFTGTAGIARFVAKHPEAAALTVGIAGTRLGTNGLSRFNRDPVATTTEAALILAPDKVLRASKGLYNIADRAVISRAFSKSKDPVVRVNGQLVGTVPTWDVTFDRAKLRSQLKREAEAAKKEKAKLEKKVKKTQRENTQLKKVNNKVKVIRNSAKALRLNPETIAKGLNKLFEVKTPTVKLSTSVRDISAKNLPVGQEALVNLLVRARKESGEAFSDIKKKIKKRFGLNVVQRTSNNQLSFRLLDPKEQRKKGVATARKKEFEFIVTSSGKVIKKEIKPNVVKVPEKDIDKLTIPQLDKLEKDIGNQLKGQRSIGFGNKKAQLKFSKGYSKRSKSVKSRVTAVRAKAKRYINRVESYKSRVKKPSKDRKQVLALGKERKQLKKIRDEIKTEVQLLKKDVSILKKLGVALTALGLSIKSARASLNGQLPLLDSVSKLSNIQKFDLPTPRAPPKGSGTGSGGRGGRGTPRSTKAPRLARPAKRAATAKRPVGKPKPPVKPKPIPRLRLTINRLKKGRKNIPAYIIVIKKGNKVLAISDVGLPRNRANNTARRIVNGNIGRFPLSSSYNIVRKGSTKIIDEKKQILNNIFRKKKSKNPKVQIFVEKRKARLNTPREVKKAQKLRRAKAKRSPKKK